MIDAEMKPFQDQTYYELLEVPVTASNDEILSAFERASELYAPDSVAIYALENPAHADELRARLREAMEILTDPDLRLEYDRGLGLAPRRPRPAEVVREREEREEEAEPSSLAAAEVLATAEAVHSTHPEFAISYVPPPEGSRAEPPAPRVEPDLAPVREALSPAPVSPEPVVRAAEPRPMEARAAEPRPMEARAAEPHPAEPRPPEPRPARPPAREVAPQIAEESAIATAEAALAQVAVKARESRPRPIEIPPDAEFNGELLRRIRESRGLSLSQVADRTRISTRHLENVEADRYAALPAVVYLRGILMNLAREYGLDALRVSKSYLTLAGKKA